MPPRRFERFNRVTFRAYLLWWLISASFYLLKSSRIAPSILKIYHQVKIITASDLHMIPASGCLCWHIYIYIYMLYIYIYTVELLVSVYLEHRWGFGRTYSQSVLNFLLCFTFSDAFPFLTPLFKFLGMHFFQPRGWKSFMKNLHCIIQERKREGNQKVYLSQP